MGRLGTSGRSASSSPPREYTTHPISPIYHGLPSPSSLPSLVDDRQPSFMHLDSAKSPIYTHGSAAFAGEDAAYQSASQEYFTQRPGYQGDTAEDCVPISAN